MSDGVSIANNKKNTLQHTQITDNLRQQEFLLAMLEV
jgi:hypothetical protein